MYICKITKKECSRCNGQESCKHRIEKKGERAATKARTLIATLLDIQPESRFLRLEGRTGSLKYGDRLEFMVLNEEGQYEDGFLTSELQGEPKHEGNEIMFETKNSTYWFRVLF
jgi:hypothetical protein